MRHIIIMPDLGQTTSEGKIVSWLKNPGDKLAMGDPLLEVETDKTTMEVETYVGGYLRKTLANPGEMVAASNPVAILTDAPDEDYGEEPKANSVPSVSVAAIEKEFGVSPVRSSGPVAAAPAARALAKQLGIDLSAVPGSGPHGLISKADVERFAAKAQTQVDIVPALQTERALQTIELSVDRSLPTEEQKRGMYRKMLLCRMFEDRVNSLFLQGRMPGTIHQAQGQEACAVGVCEALQERDMLTSTHRPHEHAVARGLPVKSLMAELFARSTGCCHGKGGSMHMGDAELGMLPAIAIVGGGIPLATGYALSFKYLNKPNIAACFFGDGAVNEGIFHEAVNMAAIWNLPVLFLCENNKYGASTSIELVMKLKAVSARASAYGIPGETVDGNDVVAVYQATLRAANRAREGRGPTLLELETYRFAGHSRSDPGHYRSKKEVAEWKTRDPIVRFEAQSLAEGLLTDSAITGYRVSVDRELDEAVAFAESSPSPLAEECLTDVYVE